MVQTQAFHGNCNWQISANDDPNLRLNAVLGACAVERFNTQMLLNPLEEQIHLPALAIQAGNQLWLQSKVVFQKHDMLACFVLDDNTAQYSWIG